MRLIKMFGLAAIAAIAAMAFVGVSSASAGPTALCAIDDELVCESPYVGHVEATSSDGELLTESGTILCDNSIILGNALGLGNPQVTHLELIDFGPDCLLNHLVSCTIQASHVLLLEILKTGANTGSVRSVNNWVVIKCGLVIHCEYGGTFTAGVALGSGATLSSTSLGKIHVNTTVQRREVLLLEGCPEQADWHATYTVQLPHDLYIKS
jgi:hypothetical protein